VIFAIPGYLAAGVPPAVALQDCAYMSCNDERMRRTTISLPDDLAEALSREARRRHASASAVTREALQQHLGLVPGPPRSMPFAAVGRSGRTSTGRDVERLIDQEWDEHDPSGG
jgi:hypothetical protein